MSFRIHSKHIAILTTRQGMYLLFAILCLQFISLLSNTANYLLTAKKCPGLSSNTAAELLGAKSVWKIIQILIKWNPLHVFKNIKQTELIKYENIWKHYVWRHIIDIHFTGIQFHINSPLHPQTTDYCILQWFNTLLNTWQNIFLQADRLVMFSIIGLQDRKYTRIMSEKWTKNINFEHRILQITETEV